MQLMRNQLYHYFMGQRSLIFLFVEWLTLSRFSSLIPLTLGGSGFRKQRWQEVVKRFMALLKNRHGCFCSLGFA